MIQYKCHRKDCEQYDDRNTCCDCNNYYSQKLLEGMSEALSTLKKCKGCYEGLCDICMLDLAKRIIEDLINEQK